MDNEVRDAALRDMQRQVARQKRTRWTEQAGALIADLYERQRWLVEDPHHRKALLAGRQVGKTWVFVRYAAHVAMRKPGSRILLIAKIRDNSKKIFWDPPDGLIVLNELHDLGWEPRLADLEFRCPNGSVVLLRGCEQESDADKFRGQKFDLVIVDEASTFPTGLLDYMLQDCIAPTLKVRKGTLVIGGTPGEVLDGTFYRVTSAAGQTVSLEPDGSRSAVARPYAARETEEWAGVSLAWSAHRISPEHNTAVPHLWDSFLEEKRANGWSDDNPKWLREYVGEWVADGQRLVYRFDANKNLWDPKPLRSKEHPQGLPAGHEWRFLIGFDPGFHDATAVEVFAFSDTHPIAYHVWEFHEKGLLLDQMAQALLDAVKFCEQGGGYVDCIVADFDQLGDAVGKQWAEEYSLTVEKSKKRDKRDHIEILNSELHEGRVKLMEGSHLVAQMAQHQWDDTGMKERSSSPNDCCDAAVYVWRKSRHFYGQPVAAPDAASIPGTPEYITAQIAERNRRQDAEAERRERGDADDFGSVGWESSDQW